MTQKFKLKVVQSLKRSTPLGNVALRYDLVDLGHFQRLQVFCTTLAGKTAGKPCVELIGEVLSIDTDPFLRINIRAKCVQHVLDLVKLYKERKDRCHE